MWTAYTPERTSTLGASHACGRCYQRLARRERRTSPEGSDATTRLGGSAEVVVWQVLDCGGAGTPFLTRPISRRTGTLGAGPPGRREDRDLGRRWDPLGNPGGTCVPGGLVRRTDLVSSISLEDGDVCPPEWRVKDNCPPTSPKRTFRRRKCPF